MYHYLHHYIPVISINHSILGDTHAYTLSCTNTDMKKRQIQGVVPGVPVNPPILVVPSSQVVQEVQEAQVIQVVLDVQCIQEVLKVPLEVQVVQLPRVDLSLLEVQQVQVVP